MVTSIWTAQNVLDFFKILINEKIFTVLENDYIYDIRTLISLILMHQLVQIYATKKKIYVKKRL